MVDSKQVGKWVRDGTISEAQAKKMLGDVKQYKKDKSYSKIIVAVSTIGAILLGIGAILFIASNWEGIPDAGKILLALAATFGSYYAGYLLKYQKNFPKTGNSLLFLGALLFGSVFVLVTQIYNIKANTHMVFLVWLLGILPLVYLLKNQPIAGLASLLFLAWLGSFFSESAGLAIAEYVVLALVSSVVLFVLGGVHYFKKDFFRIGRVYRIVGLKLFLITTFILTLGGVAGKLSEASLISEEGAWLSFFVIFSLSAVAVLMAVVNWFFNRSGRISRFEGPVALGILGLAVIFYSYPSSTPLYPLIFNLVMMFMIGLLIYLGYTREDMLLVYMGNFWLAVFIVAKYFDFFWGLLDRSLFFIVGGLILILGGIGLEKERRRLKEKFRQKIEKKQRKRQKKGKVRGEIK